MLILTRRPTRVVEAVLVDVPWPRDSRSLTSPEFVAIKSHYLEVFNREVEASAGIQWRNRIGWRDDQDRGPVAQAKP